MGQKSHQRTLLVEKFVTWGEWLLKGWDVMDEKPKVIELQSYYCAVGTIGQARTQLPPLLQMGGAVLSDAGSCA
jgi:hypothetical protein